jgi:SAM-dependent methyltransferase
MRLLDRITAPLTALDRAKHEDGLPIPPRRLRFDVAGTDDLEWFLSLGRAGAENLRDVLTRSGRPIETFDAILDFGCGCGRVIRYFADLEDVDINGTDVSRRAIGWCRRNLPFASFERNSVEPRTVYDDDRFGFIYALSVFTHLPEALQFAWIRELQRILRPRGLLAITVHGDRFLDQLTANEAADFKAGRLVVRRADAAGLNHCAVFHPPSWVKARLAQGFDVVDFIPEGALGNPPQDLFLLRATQ